MCGKMAPLALKQKAVLIPWTSTGGMHFLRRGGKASRPLVVFSIAYLGDFVKSKSAQRFKPFMTLYRRRQKRQSRFWNLGCDAGRLTDAKQRE